MVICIDEFLEKVHRPALSFTKVATEPSHVGTETDDDGPNDDPPNALRNAA
jgi:hypothetical protein